MLPHRSLDPRQRPIGPVQRHGRAMDRMPADHLHRRGVDLGRMIHADRQSVGQAEGRPKAKLGLRGVEIGIGRARLPGVRLARFALAGRGHVVDMLERAPQSLRPVLRPDHDVQADQRDVAFRTDGMSSGERLGDVDDVGVFDHVIARSHRRRVRRIERTPRGFDRDRAHGQFRGMGRIGQVLAQAPAMSRKRIEYSGSLRRPS